MADRIKLILALSGEGGDLRKDIVRGVVSGKSGAEVAFVATTDEMFKGVIARKPSLLLLSWDDVHPEDLAVFLQKVRAHPAFAALPCVLLVSEGVDPTAIAMSGEYGIFKIISTENLSVSMPTALQEISEELARPSSLRSFIIRIDQARAKSAFGEVDTAVQDFYTLFPENLRAMLEYANLCIRRADWTQAKAVAEKAVEKNASDVRAINVLARILLHEGKHTEAQTVLHKAELLSPKNAERLILLGDIFFDVGKNAEARAKYAEALAIDGSSKDAKQGLGKVDLSEGQVNEALTMFRDCSSEEEIGAFFNNAAIFAVRKKRFDQANHLYASAIGVLTKGNLRAKVYFNMGLAHERSNKKKDAQLFFSHALNADPTFDKAQKALDRMGMPVIKTLPVKAAVVPSLPAQDPPQAVRVPASPTPSLPSAKFIDEEEEGL